MQIKKIECKVTKQNITKSILESLPDWFGIPEAIDEYIKESANMPFYAAFEESNAIGFVAIKEHNSSSAEIYVMAVLKQYHRKGLGKNLVNSCIAYCKDNHYEFLQVKTLDKSNPDSNYAKTRDFYCAMGFKPLECLQSLWGKNNPCLIMIKHINIE